MCAYNGAAGELDLCTFIQFDETRCVLICERKKIAEKRQIESDKMRVKMGNEKSCLQ